MSLQRFRGAQSGQITAADTAAHAFPTLVVGFVWLQAASANTGTVTVSASDVGQTYASGGIVIPSTYPIKVGPIENFEALSYTFSVAGDKLNWFAIN